MKKSLTLIAILAATYVNVNAQSGVIIKDLSTGINDATSVQIPYGSNDDTWRVRWPAGSGGGLGYNPALVCSNLDGTWATDDCARWITHKLETGGTNPDAGGVTGKYVYQTSFQFNSTCTPWVKITFNKIGADNRARFIRINGYSYTVGPLSWASTSWYNPLKSAVVIDINLSHLVQGTNVIEIEVDNDESYEGLFICGYISRGYCS